jgi:capsular exopolysaccharide synthesis family protein
MSKNFELLRASGHADILRPFEPRSQPPSLGRLGYERPMEQQRHDEPDWMRVSGTIKKQWKLAARFALATFAVVAIVTLMTKPVYEPVAEIEVDPPGTEVFSLQGNGAPPPDSDYLQTQAQKLKSDQLALEVIRTLHLDQNPDLVAKGKASLKSAPADGNGSVQLSPAENQALRVFQERLNVNRDSDSHLIRVSFASHEPALAASITNTMLDTFIEESYSTRHAAIVKSTEWLSRQLDDIRKRMDESNRALADFERDNGIADTGNNRNTVAEEMADLDRQLTQAEADRIQLQAFLARERETSPDTLPQVRANPVIQQLTEKLVAVREELAKSEVIYGKNYPDIKKLQNEERELESQIAYQRSLIVGELKTSYAAAKAREQMMGAQIRDTTKKLNQMARYNELRKDAQANTDLYNSLYAKIKEAGIAAASTSSNMRIIDRARVLDSPTRPRRKLNLAMGLLAGICGGILLAFIREGLDGRIHTVADVRNWVGLPGILVIPEIGGWGRKLLPGADEPPTGSRRLLEQPYSPQAEAIRGLHASILSSRNGRTPQVVLVVSSLPNEGKTTIAVALAAALAQHSRVCLIDTDLRKPGVGQALGIPAEEGLAEVLAGSAVPEEIMVTDPSSPNLSAILAGLIHHDPAAALNSARMRKLLADLRQAYDFVIIDSAPVLAYADIRIISPMADGVVLVARSGITTREAMARTKEILAEIQGAPILNVVLNGADSIAAGYFYQVRGS